MMLKSSKIFFSLFFVFLSFTQLNGEEKIDIWKNDKKQKTISEKNKNIKLKIKDNQNLQETSKILSEEKISIEEGSSITSNEIKVYGVYDPQDFNFNLNMWSLTKAEDVRASIKRLKKIKLSRTSNDILEKVLMSFSYPPEGMSEKEFANLKINWLIENNRSNLIENFLKQNEEFEGKSRAVQYLVDEKITEANIKEGCEKIKFIDSTIKDAYLEKFKIYCLVFNNKKSEAQLLLDLLREQKQSDKFFDDKIDYLLGISDKTSKKINEKNLLNFYLSSVTIENFNYQPNVNTKKEIWKYLNAANLIKLEDISDKKRIEELEIAANKGQIDEKIIFAIYKQIPFNLNTLVNAKSVYQTLNKTDARSLIYQKYLLSENVDSKLEYLFLLDDLFKKDKKTYIFSKFLSDSLKQIGVDNIPESYKEISQKKILSDEEIELGKVKYNDKVLHQSKIIKFYLEQEEEKKTQKDINRIFKKISKNKKYFYSAKDIALTESLIKDGFKIPSNFNYVEIAEKYEVPKNLLQLIKNEQNAFLILKIVEIIGEDEPHQLDPETIYFITNLLNETGLKKIRNKVLISALPQRV